MGRHGSTSTGTRGSAGEVGEEVVVGMSDGKGVHAGNHEDIQGEGAGSCAQVGSVRSSCALGAVVGSGGGWHG